MIPEIADIHIIHSRSDYECMILENKLIRKHKPKYNIMIRDERNYKYILITIDEYPKIKVRGDKKEPGVYFGPFISRFRVYSILKYDSCNQESYYARNTTIIESCDTLYAYNKAISLGKKVELFEYKI